MGIPGQIGFSLPYVVDLISPERRSMTWNFYNSSARYVTLLIFNIIRSIPQRTMVAVSCTNVGLDHGAGHSLLLLCDAKASRGKNSMKFKGLGDDLFNVFISLF